MEIISQAKNIVPFSNVVRLAEWSKAPDLRIFQVFYSTIVGVGSNPTPDSF